MRPRMSIKDRLSNLHLLLRASSFARLPLELRFFSEDMYQAWLKLSESAQCTARSGIAAFLSVTEAMKPDLGTCELIGTHLEIQEKGSSSGGIESISINYAPYKNHVEKSLLMLTEGGLVYCGVCSGCIATPATMALVCPNNDCQAVSHMTCLARRFTNQEAEPKLLPTTGNCPGCRAKLKWAQLVTELSLRMRGDKDIVLLMKKSRRSQGRASNIKSRGSAHNAWEHDHSDVEDDFDEAEEYGDVLAADVLAADVVDEPLLEEARYDLPSDEDAMSVTSVESDTSHFSRVGSPSNKIESYGPRLEIVIENSSDWDDAQVLD